MSTKKRSTINDQRSTSKAIRYLLSTIMLAAVALGLTGCEKDGSLYYTAMTWAPNGDLLYVKSESESIKTLLGQNVVVSGKSATCRFDIRTKKETELFRGGAWKIIPSPDGQKLIMGDTRVVDYTGKKLLELPAHPTLNTVTAVGWSPDNSRILCVGAIQQPSSDTKTDYVTVYDIKTSKFLNYCLRGRHPEFENNTKFMYFSNGFREYSLDLVSGNIVEHDSTKFIHYPSVMLNGYWVSYDKRQVRFYAFPDFQLIKEVNIDLKGNDEGCKLSPNGRYMLSRGGEEFYVTDIVTGIQYNRPDLTYVVVGMTQNFNYEDLPVDFVK